MKNSLPVSILKLHLLIIIFTSFCTSSSAQWTRKADAFKSRSDLSESLIYNSKLYTFLGFYDHDRHTNSTSEAYDPATDTYTLLAPMPDTTATMTHEKVVLIDNTVWLIGGRLGQNPGPLTSAIWIYNIATDSWSRGPELTDPSTGEAMPWAAGGAALVGRTLHIFGGFIYTACRNDQSEYHLTLDVDSWLSDKTKPAQWKNILAPLPVKRNHFSTVVLGGKIYVIGGQFGHDCGGGQEKRFSHVYDPATDSWTMLPLLPEARSHAEGSSFAIDGKIYIVGGQNQHGKSTDLVTTFTPNGNNGEGTWENDTSFTLPAPYEGGTAKIIGHTFIFSFGGQGTSAKPKSENYSRSILRNPVYKFGFSSSCFTQHVDSGNSVNSETLLFTTDSSKSYQVSSDAKWLKVTRNATGVAMPNGAVIGITINTAGLTPGNYNGILTASGTNGGTEFTEATYCVSLKVNSSKNDGHILEAENAGLNGVRIAKNHSGYSGSGFVDYLVTPGDYVEWAFTKEEAAQTLLSFRYSNGGTSDRPMQLTINGTAAESSVSFPPTRGWDNWAMVTSRANLRAGKNVIRLTTIGTSGPNVDYVAYENESSTLLVAAAAIQQNISAASSSMLVAHVSPNPAYGDTRLLLNTTSLLPVTVEILDNAGRAFKKLFVPAHKVNNFPFSVAGLSPGIYLIRVRQGIQVATTKFIVRK